MALPCMMSLEFIRNATVHGDRVAAMSAEGIASRYPSFAAGFWFLVAERWLRGIVANRWARYAAAFGGVLVGATSWSVWNQSTVNEKVYTVSLFSIALVMWLVVRWGDDAPGPHRDRWLVLIAYVLGRWQLFAKSGETDADGPGANCGWLLFLTYARSARGFDQRWPLPPSSAATAPGGTCRWQARRCSPHLLDPGCHAKMALRR